jgi:hypothetical protein
MNYILEWRKNPNQYILRNRWLWNWFYAFFLLESVEKKSLKHFWKTIELLHKDKDYTDYDMKTKMLSFCLHILQLL